MGGTFINIPGASTWKAPVSTAANLPSTGNQNGDVRVALDTSDIWEWNGTSWVLIASPGGVGPAFGIIQVPFGTNPVADTATDTLTFTSSNSSVVITGDATTDTVDFTVNPFTSPLTTKGDLYGHSTIDARVPVGTNGQILTADSTQATGLRYDSLLTGTSGTDFAIAYVSGTQTFNLPIASATNTGKLSNTDWSTFNSKQNALTFGNLTDAGTDGIIITGGTGAVIGSGTSIAQHVADSTHNGYLSSTDWTTFNSKQSALTFGNFTDVGTDGITVTGGTGAVIGSGTSISQHVADSTHNGYLSSTDWSTFNGKQAAGNYITALTGDVSASGPGSVAATVNSVGGSSAANINTATVLVTGNKTANTVLAGPTTGAAAAATFRALVAADLPAGTGTVTSVALTAPSSILSVSGSPVTTSGTLALSLATQTANTVWAGPTSGGAATPTFRALVASDIPSLSTIYANRALSNLASVAINTSPLPGVDNTIDAGSATKRFRGLYALAAYDSANTVSIDIESKYLLNAGGGTIVLDWGAQLLQDNGGDVSLNWTNRTLTGGSLSAFADTLNWGTCELFDFNPNLSLDWRYRQTYDGGTTLSIDWDQRQLNNNVPAVSLDWGNQVLIDTVTVTPVLDWSTGVIRQPGGSQSIDWNNRFLADTAGNQVVDWENGIMNISGGSNTLDWLSCQLYDTTNLTSIDWTARHLVGSDGSKVLLDWSSAVAGNSGISIPKAYGSGYQRVTPATGATVTVNNDISNLVIRPAGTIATLTVNLPSNPFDTQEITICSSQIITALTVSGNGHTMIGAVSTLGVGGFAKYKYVSTDTSYYRIG